MKYLFTFAVLLLFTSSASANFLDKLNSKIKAVESINNTADRAENAAKRSSKRVTKTDGKSADKKYSEWKKDLRVATKGVRKACKKKINFEFEPRRFKEFLSSNQSPGATCGEIAKSLEFDLCIDKAHADKVSKKISTVKCYYTSSSDSSVKLRLNNNVLLVGFSQNVENMYEDSMIWLQDNL